MEPIKELYMQDHWEATAAIGTMAAVVVALFLARQTERQILKSNKKVAELVAARLLESVRFLADELRHQTARFAFYKEEQDGLNESFGSEFLSLISLIDYIDIHTLQALEPLPKNCANRLAMALGIIDALGKEIRFSRELCSWPKLSSAYRQHYVARWVSMCDRGSDYFFVVQKDLEIAAGIVAPRPSAEEIHGEWNDTF